MSLVGRLPRRFIPRKDGVVIVASGNDGIEGKHVVTARLAMTEKLVRVLYLKSLGIIFNAITIDKNNTFRLTIDSLG